MSARSFYHVKSVADEAALDVQCLSFAACSLEEACKVARSVCAERGGRVYVKREGSEWEWDWRGFRASDGQVLEGRGPRG